MGIHYNIHHGWSRTRLYAIHGDMKRRCKNPALRNYKHYGGRGISVCPEWDGEHGFEHFRDWALSNGYKEDLMIDRINTDGNYEPSNCRWVNRSTQNANKRNIGECEYIGVSKNNATLFFRTTIKQNGKIIFLYMSKSKNDCAAKRNEFIMRNKLQLPLNDIKEEYEEILRGKVKYTWIATDKETGERISGDNLKEFSKKVGLTAGFIGQCIKGKRNSQKYDFKKVLT